MILEYEVREVGGWAQFVASARTDEGQLAHEEYTKLCWWAERYHSVRAITGRDDWFEVAAGLFSERMARDFEMLRHVAAAKDLLADDRQIRETFRAALGILQAEVESDLAARGVNVRLSLYGCAYLVGCDDDEPAIRCFVGGADAS